MADYDIQQLDIEDVEIDDDSYEGEDEYEEIPEFPYNEEEAEERWKDFTFPELVGEMANYVSSGKKFFFISKKKRVVNAQEIDTLSNYIQSKFPAEFDEAVEIIETRDSIINEAQAEADSTVADAKAAADSTKLRADEYCQTTIADANAEAERIIAQAKATAHEMIMEHNITKGAQAQAALIEQQTIESNNQRIAQATNECNNLKSEALNFCINAVNLTHSFVQDSLKAYHNIAADNITKINEAHSSLESDFAKIVSDLGLNK